MTRYLVKPAERFLERISEPGVITNQQKPNQNSYPARYSI